MRTKFLSVALMLSVLSTLTLAQGKPAGTDVDQFVLSKVRILPKPGASALLAGGRITGSNEGPTTAFVELARIGQAPAGNGWLEVPVPPGRVYRFVKFESAQGTGIALAEVEFHSPAGRLSGRPFGTSVPKEKAANSFEKALDGDRNTIFETSTDHSYVGIDLGSQAQAPRPQFKPAGGSFEVPQKVEISTWPGGATLRYTTDGSVPSDSNGQVYRRPITIVALVHYACIYGESPEGKVTFANSGLTREQAAVFQKLAWETVIAEPLTGVRR